MKKFGYYFALIGFILSLAAQVSAGSILEPTFRGNLRDIRLEVKYTSGGISREALAKILDPNTTVKIAPGGYFNPASKPLGNVDYTLVEGRVLTPYLFQKARPVILFSKKRGARIAWPDKYTKGFSRHEDELYGLAGDRKCQRPERPLARTIIGITKTTLSVFYVTATENRAKALMKRTGYKLDQYLFMDGGTSACPTTKMPSHIIIMRDTK